MSLYTLLVFIVLALNLATADNFEMSNGPGSIRSEDRDPFKEGYFHIVISCFALMFFFIGCMFSVRICLGNKRTGNDSRSFFLVA